MWQLFCQASINGGEIKSAFTTTLLVLPPEGLLMTKFNYDIKELGLTI